MCQVIGWQQEGRSPGHNNPTSSSTSAFEPSILVGREMKQVGYILVEYDNFHGNLVPNTCNFLANE